MNESGLAVSIAVNGETREVPKDLTITGLLDHLEMKGGQVAVARNTEIVPRSDFETVRIRDGDRIEIVHAIGGGAG